MVRNIQLINSKKINKKILLKKNLQAAPNKMMKKQKLKARKKKKLRSRLIINY
jgi:hypothetical protein